MTYQRITELDTTEISYDEATVEAVRGSWGELRAGLDPDTLETLDARLRRRWSIETGLIEGLYTIDRGITRTLIEHGLHADLIGHGSSDVSGIELVTVVQDHDDAFELLVQIVAHERPLTTSFIKELHALLTRHEDSTVAKEAGTGRLVRIPLLRGEWKQQPNNPERPDGTVHEYAPVLDVSSEMSNLVDWHSGHKHSHVESVIEAAWLHHRFTQIHPFQDGNGRVARSLASVVLLRNGLLPHVVDRDERVRYIAALEAADDGDLNPLVNLFVYQQVRQLQEMRDEIAKLGSVDEVLERSLARLRERRTEEGRIDSSGARRVRRFADSIQPVIADAVSVILDRMRSGGVTDVQMFAGGVGFILEPAVNDVGIVRSLSESLDHPVANVRAMATIVVQAFVPDRASVELIFYVFNVDDDERVRAVAGVQRNGEFGAGPREVATDGMLFPDVQRVEHVPPATKAWIDAAIKHWSIRWSEAL